MSARQGWCKGAGERHAPALDEVPAPGGPRRVVRCPVCRRRLTLMDVWSTPGGGPPRAPQEGQLSHFEVPPHKARVHRAKGPRRASETRAPDRRLARGPGRGR